MNNQVVHCQGAWGCTIHHASPGSETTGYQPCRLPVKGGSRGGNVVEGEGLHQPKRESD